MSNREEFENAIIILAKEKDYQYMDSLLFRFAEDDSYRQSWVDSAWIGWQLFDKQAEERPVLYETNFAIKREHIASLQAEVDQLKDIVKAVAHIGVDWGYGEYELEDKHIKAARDWYESNNDVQNPTLAPPEAK